MKWLLIPALCFLILLAWWPGTAEGCRLLWDASRGPSAGVNESSVYASFLKSMTSSSGFNINVTQIRLNSTLDAVDYEGVGILWIDSKHSGTDPSNRYSPTELDSIHNFVHAGGSLLLTADSDVDDAVQLVTWAAQLFEVGSSPTVFWNATDGRVNTSLSNSIFTNGVSQIQSGGSGLAITLAPKLQPTHPGVVLSGEWGTSNNGIVEGVTAVVYTKYLNKGRVVLVWDSDALDGYYGMGDNAQLAHNILSYLTEDCKSSSLGCGGKCSPSNGRCYGDYCYCNSNTTGIDCTTVLLPCNYVNGCPAIPVSPTPDKPVQCASGRITFGPEDCDPEIDCYYYYGEVACINGSCLHPDVCMAMTTNCPGVVCSNGKCVSSVLDCPIVPYCYSGAFRCPGGVCVPDLSLCPSVQTCGTGEILCLDGVCRPECPLYDGCNDGPNNFMCPSFVCVNGTNATAIECDQPCVLPNRKPFGVKTWDNWCSLLLLIAPPFVKPLPVKVLVSPSFSMEIPIYSDDFNKVTGWMYITNGTFDSPVTLVISPIGLGNLRDTLGEFSSYVLASVPDFKIQPASTFNNPIFIKFETTPPQSNVTKHFNASLVFIDDVNNNWIGLYSTVLSTRRPTTGSGSGTSPTATVGGPTTHFTSFSVLVGEYNTDSTNSGGDGGDGNLDIILPAVLVPVVVGGMVFVAVVVAVSVALFSWWKWQVVHGSIQASESAVGL